MALVSIEQGLWWPYQLAQGLSSPGAVGTTLNTATQKIHFYGRMYIQGRATNKVLSAAGGGSIQFVASGVTFATGGTTLDIGLQDLSVIGTPARPDGVFDVKRTMSAGTDTIVNGFNTVAMDTGSKTLSHGDLISVVFDLTARAGADAVNINFQQNTGMFGQTNVNQQHFPGANVFTGGAWSTGSSQVPNVLITFDDGTLGFIDGTTFTGLTASEAFTDATNPDERGLLFQVPFACNVDAFKAFISSLNPLSDLTFSLYSTPLGTPASIAAVSALGVQMVTVASGTGWIEFPLTTPVTLTANTDYCAAIKATGTQNVALAFSPLNATAHRALYPGGTNIRKATRNNLTGAFAAESPATTMYNMGVRLSAFDLGAAVQDVNVTHVNGTPVGGSGTGGDPWGPSGASAPPLSANIVQVKGIPVTGLGTAGSPWGP